METSYDLWAEIKKKVEQIKLITNRQSAITQQRRRPFVFAELSFPPYEVCFFIFFWSCFAVENSWFFCPDWADDGVDHRCTRSLSQMLFAEHVERFLSAPGGSALGKYLQRGAIDQSADFIDCG